MKFGKKNTAAAKKVKNIESMSNNNTQKTEDSKQVKTGWWDI